jgi:23S rRNA pseudouridine1911/1915/1917 synthase
VQRILRTQATLRGQPPAKPGALVAAGDEVVIRRPWGHEPEVPRQVRIVYADQALLCVDKPAGLPMHPTARYYHHTLTALLRRAFPGQPLQLAHRLDRETSGLLLVARGRDAGSALKRAFASRRVHKCYLALVRGTLADDDGRIDLPLRLEGGSIRVRMRVCAAGEEGLPSRTRYRVLRRLPGHTLLEAWPETGRQHQIRAHLAAIGHPLVGDKLYGGNGRLFVAYAEHRLTAEMRGELGLERHALHAHRITFPHPTRGVEMTLESSLPEDIVDYLRRISLDANE